MIRLAAVASALVANVLADQKSLDCPLRQIAIDMAQQLQPWRPVSAFQAMADALNGAQEAQNCSVGPTGPVDRTARRMLAFPLPKGGLQVFVDGRVGSDVTGDGSITRPLATLHAAVAQVRSKRAAAGVKHAASAPQAHIVLRHGTHYLGRTLELGSGDSKISFQAYPGEEAFVSGAIPINGVSWQAVVPPNRDAYEYKPGMLATGFDVAPAGQYTVSQAQTLCNSIPQCAGFTYDSSDPNPASPVTISFKSATFWSNQGGWSTYVKNYGYVPGAVQSLYVADVSSVFSEDDDIDAIRLNGVRGIRARYPNARTVELMGAMQIDANQWIGQNNGTNADYTFNPSSPVRNDSAPDGNGVGYFQEFRLGIGGPCASRFTPQASYWCANYTQGGGPGPYEAPIGMVVSNAATALPHSPYAGDVSRATVHSWRAGRWFSWVFGVGSSSWNPATNSTTFNFVSGGHQGSRGGNSGQEFFIDNILDELDAPGEFYYDKANRKLYVWFNGTDPSSTLVEVPRLVTIINATGTQADPVVGTGFSGLGFKDSTVNFLGPHGTPAGGDWAVERNGALFYEGTTGSIFDGCLFLNLDANGIFFSGFNRNATVQRSEFEWIGETAISQWGYTDGSPVPGMGFDGTAGNQPRGTQVLYNLVHEVGLWTKQNSFYFQSESGQNLIQGNIAYNGPRAGINFDDGFLGGSVVTKNVLFNFCRESSDHGPFNSWNRQVYLFDGPDGTPTTQKANDTISYNWVLANYHSSMAIDNDDGSSYYDTHHNVFISAASDAAYGGNSLKSDFGGHANYHHDNLDLFWSRGFGIVQALAGQQDGYYGNYLWLGQDGPYGDGQSCSGPTETKVWGNTLWSPKGAIQECGMSLAAYQAQGGDPGTTGAAYPDDNTVLTLARNILGVPAFE